MKEQHDASFAATPACALPGCKSTRTILDSNRFLAIVLILGTLAAFYPLCYAGFIWDDDSILLKNHFVQSTDGWWQAWCNRSADDFVPATITSFWLEWRFWGANPFGYHLDNVLLHVCSVLLVWRALARLEVPGAWLAAALFAIHPVNVESVAWITQRKNTLTMVFFLLTVIFYLTFEDTGRRRCLWLAAGMFFLALMGKTAVVPLPLILLGLAWWRRGRIVCKDVLHGLTFAIMAAAGALMAIWIQHGAATGVIVRGDGFWARLAGAGWALWFYLGKALLPVNLNFVYPRWQIPAANPISYLPLLLWMLGLFIFWLYRHQSWGKGSLMALGYFSVMLLPVLGFFNIFFMLYSLVSDHWQYFAIIGPLALMAAGLKSVLAGLAENKWVAGGGCAVLLSSLFVLTWMQCGMYANIESLWQTTLARNPNCWMARGNFGNFFAQRGQFDQAIAQYDSALQIKPDNAEARRNLGLAFFKTGQLDKAVEQYQKSLQIEPASAESRVELGNALLQMGRTDDARSQFEQVLQIQPANAEAHNNLGNVFLQAGRLDDAVLQFEKAVELRPDFAEAENDLGACFYRQDRMMEAVAHYQRAVSLKPDYGNARMNLANALLNMGRPAEAVIQFQKAVQLAPENPRLLVDFAWFLATCPDQGLRDGMKALALARRANDLTRGSNPNVLHALAAALAEAGQFPEAMQTAQQALDIAKTQSNSKLAGQLQIEMNLYESGKPFRMPAPTR